MQDDAGIVLHLAFGICFYMGFGGAKSVASASALEAVPPSLKGTVAAMIMIGTTLGGTIMQFLYVNHRRNPGASRRTGGSVR